MSVLIAGDDADELARLAGPLRGEGRVVELLAPGPGGGIELLARGLEAGERMLAARGNDAVVAVGDGEIALVASIAAAKLLVPVIAVRSDRGSPSRRERAIVRLASAEADADPAAIAERLP